MKINTINKKEIEKFSNIAEEWWDPQGKFKPLHKFNPTRISYIKDHIVKTFELKNSEKPLKNVKILDIGCGGGLLTEPMKKLGANVVGIDASEKNIQVAKIHSKKNNLDIEYQCASPENFGTKVKFDVILNMEIVEHVEDVDFFLKSSSQLLRKGGIMFIATLNKTLKSYLFAIIGAEYILRWLPVGTHEWEKFVKPEDLVSILRNHNLKLDCLDGMKLDIIKDKWGLSSDKSVNYIGKFIKI
tara:strand:- start:117 stop:845 length:729 start_codon:yes stop_codon:yes gene_type:complete